QGVLQAATTTGRHGAYYLPGGYDAQPMPLLVALHGTNASGAPMPRRLQSLADKQHFVVVAPDSASVAGAWVVGQKLDEQAEDYRSLLGTAREVLARPGVRVDRARVLIAGYSVGGSMALHVASHDDL